MVLALPASTAKAKHIRLNATADTGSLPVLHKVAQDGRAVVNDGAKSVSKINWLEVSPGDLRQIVQIA